jgi:hypothetical protein
VASPELTRRAWVGRTWLRWSLTPKKVNKIATAGIEAPAVIHSVRATGTPDISGATMTDFDVTIRPDGGEAYETTIEQSMLPFQMEGISEGMAIVVKYDPDNRTAAILHSW